MKHHGSLLGRIAVHVLQVELHGQAEVKLTGGKRNLCANGRLYVYVQLWAIEGSLTDLLGVLDADVIEHLTKGCLCGIPHVIIGIILLGISGITQGKNAAIIRDAKVIINVKDQVNNLLELFLDLARRYEQMRIILAEMSYSLDTL